MKRKKTISFFILLFLGIWFFQYFLGYIPGAYTIGVFLIGTTLWCSLFVIALYQLIKFLFEKPRHNERPMYALAIIAALTIVFSFPKGIVDWEKYEGENLLVAHMKGTANCNIILKLKNDNTFKYTSNCFGKDFYFGTYHISNDTIYFELKNQVGFMDKSSYATLHKRASAAKYHQLSLYRNYTEKRSVGLVIEEVDMEKLLLK